MITPGTTPIKFQLKQETREYLLNKKIDWSDNILGLVTVYRTYLRTKENGKLETWNEAVVRVIEGMFSIQKTHVTNTGLIWDEEKAQRTALDAAERLFSFKWTPPGRGLWMMGTDFMWERGGAALNNCGFVSTKNLAVEHSEPFRFLMDMSMLGVGVGFDTEGHGSFEVKQPVGEEKVIVVEDTREGWVDAIGSLIDSYAEGTNPICIDTSKVRKYGEPIKGFGGVASGPLPLIQGFNGIKDVLQKRVGEKITSVDITDIQNIIGKIVVAGNVRRTAEIAFANPKDDDFRQMKSWVKHPVETGVAPPEELKDVSKEEYEIYKNNPFSDEAKAIAEKYQYEEWAYKFGGWRWTSNNSLFAEVGMDYTEIAQSIAENGEPGLAWLENMRNYGRMIDGPDYKDTRVAGGNPSLRKGTLVYTTEGIVPIEDLEGENFKTVNHKGDVVDATCFLSGYDKPLIKVGFGKGRDIYATPEHEWPVVQKDGSVKKVRTDELKSGDLLPKNPIDSREFGDGSFEDGYALGVFFADGHFSKRLSGPKRGEYMMGVENCNYQQVKAVADFFMRHKSNSRKVNVKTRQREGMKDTYTAQCSSQDLADVIITKFGMVDKNYLPTSVWTHSDDFVKGFIQGLFSTDGSTETTKIILHTSKKGVAEDMSKLLGFYGIEAGYTTRKPRKVTFPNGKDYGKEYDHHEVRVNSGDALRFTQLVGFDSEEKQRIVLDRLSHCQYVPYTKIESVEDSGLYEDVWDITVYDDTHTFATEYVVTGNCLEQSLESYELCCLVETYPSNHESAKDFYDTLKVAYLYAKTVTLMATHNPRTNTVMCRNRRIGCSQSGIIDAVSKFSRHYYQKNMLDKAYQKIEHYDNKYSEWLGVPKSIKRTSVKPSGSVSLLANVSPGVHFPKVRYGYRTMRLAKDSPLVDKLREANYRIEASQSDPYRTVVVYFPIVGKEDVPTEADSNIWEQFTNAVMLQRYWADNQVSITISFKENEKDQIAKCLSVFDSELKGVSLLPLMDHGYPQAPYIPTSKEEAVNYKKSLGEVDFSDLNDSLKEGENSESNKFCDGESCTI